jgi:pimeloyl-ACP methyl ester carboxylesterase
VEHIRIPVPPHTFDAVVAGPGDGDAVLLLHGFPQTTAAWAGVQQRLAGAGFRVVAPAMRGYSPDARPEAVEAYGIGRLVGDVLAIADAAGLGRFHLVGHDWGGVLAWQLATGRQDRIRTVTSLSTPHPAAIADVAWRSPQLLQSAYIPFFRLPVVPEQVLLAGGGNLLARLLRRSGLDDDHAERYRDAMLEPGALTAALNYYRAASPRLTRTAPASTATLYVWSSGDVALGRAAAEQTAHHVRGPYRFEVLDGVSHWIPEEAPDAVSDLVLEHLRGGAPDV